MISQDLIASLLFLSQAEFLKRRNLSVTFSGFNDPLARVQSIISIFSLGL